MHHKISYIFAVVCLHILTKYSIYTILQSTGSVVLHLSLGGPLRFFGGLQLLISSYKGPFPTKGKRTFFSLAFQEHVLESSLSERRSVLGCCALLTPLLLLLSLSKKSALCVHQLFCLNSTVLSDALDNFHLSNCYYTGARPLRV